MGGDFINIIEIIVGVLTFVIAWSIWSKVVDKVDKWLQEKVRDKTYTIITNTIFLIALGFLVYVIFIH